MKLRPYQAEAVASIFKALDEHDSTLVVQPTGTGKTVVFSHVARIFYERTMKRVLVMAHRDELISQAYEKIRDITGIEPEVEKGEAWADQYEHWKSPIVITSVQTQVAGQAGRGRMTRFDPDEFGLMIIDEAHHAPAASYKRVIDHYKQNPKFKVLGVTATPDRLDEKALGEIFDSVAIDYELPDAIKEGWLVPITQSFIEVDGLDLSAVKSYKHDLRESELATILEYEAVMHSMVVPTLEITRDRKTIFFTVRVQGAERIAEIINRHKPGKAFCLSAKTPDLERRELVKRFVETDEFQYLVNVGIATEGFDAPSVECIVMGRPTKSRALYAQCIGRGTRPLTGVLDGLNESDEFLRRDAISGSAKPQLEVIDFSGNAGKHKLVCTADVLGGRYDEEVVARAREIAEETTDGTPVDMEEVLKRAAGDIERRKKIKTNKAKYRKTSINPFDVLDVRAYRSPQYGEIHPSTRQIAALEKFGVESDAIGKLSKAQASQLLDKLVGNAKKGLASYKQQKFLQRYGIDTSQLPFSTASAYIGQIRKNNWVCPRYLQSKA